MSQTTVYSQVVEILQAGASEAQGGVIAAALADQGVRDALIGWAARADTWGLLEMGVEAAYAADPTLPVHGLLGLCRWLDGDVLHAELQCLVGQHHHATDSLSQSIWRCLLMQVPASEMKSRFRGLTPAKCLTWAEADASADGRSVYCRDCGDYLRIDIPGSAADLLAARHRDLNGHTVEIHVGPADDA